MPWEKGAPSPGLVDFLAAHPGLVRGSVAVPGCGTGHDVREWARCGFTAFGFDLAPSAVTLAEQRTAAAGLKARFQLADFLRADPPQIFDWLFEHTLFCAIQPCDRDAYVRAVLRWLKPGGHYLAVNYFDCGRRGRRGRRPGRNNGSGFRRSLSCGRSGRPGRSRTGKAKSECSGGCGGFERMRGGSVYPRFPPRNAREREGGKARRRFVADPRD